MLGLFALFVLVSLLTRWLSLVVEVLDMDEAAHAVGSWVLLDGGRLYTDFVDNKPPLLYGYYALAQLLLGRGLLPVHALTAIVTVPLVRARRVRRVPHDRRGVAAGLLWLVYGASFLAHDMLAANAELVLLLPASWAIALVADEGRAVRWRPLLLAGLLLGLATLVKHQAAFWLPALGWAALRARPSKGEAGRAPRLLALGAGFALPLLATWVAFAATGGARDLLYWLVWRNVLTPRTRSRPRGRSSGRRATCCRGSSRRRPCGGRGEPPAPGSTSTTGGWSTGWWCWGCCRPWRASASSPTTSCRRSSPSLSGAGPAVARWWERPRERAGRVFLAATLVVALGFAGANAWLYLGNSGVYRETDPVYREVAERLAADECFPGSRLFVWGRAPAFYYEAGLRGARPASRFAVLASAGLTGYVPGNPDGARRREPGEPVPAPAHWDWLMADLERARATYVLDTAPAGLYRWNRYPLRDYPPLDRYVTEAFERIDEVSRVRVHRRRGCAAR